MDERWQQIERIFLEARELKQSEQAEFLGKACGEDAELRREVESLLAKTDQVGSFLENPAIAEVAEALVDDEHTPELSNAPHEIGTMVAHYRLTGKLGGGGIGSLEFRLGGTQQDG